MCCTDVGRERKCKKETLGYTTHPDWIYGEPDVHEEEDSVLQHVDAVVPYLLDGGADGIGDAGLPGVDVVDGEEARVEEHHGRVDVHRGHGGHEERGVIATELKKNCF